MTPAVSVTGLGRRYHDHEALADVTFELGTPCIAGLLGRNGAGKTTLLRILAGQETATTGRVHVCGAEPLENDAVLRRMVLVREDQTYPDLRVRHAISAAALLCPNWDAELAGTLLDAAELPQNRPVKKLSRGMRTALGNVIGLDAVARTRFYDHLLADYTAHPRAGGVERFVADRTTLSRRTSGTQARVVMTGRADARDRELADHLHLRPEGVSLQQLAVYAAEHHERTAAGAS